MTPYEVETLTKKISLMTEKERESCKIVTLMSIRDAIAEIRIELIALNKKVFEILHKSQ